MAGAIQPFPPGSFQIEIAKRDVFPVREDGTAVIDISRLHQAVVDIFTSRTGVVEVVIGMHVFGMCQRGLVKFAVPRYLSGSRHGYISTFAALLPPIVYFRYCLDGIGV